MRRSPDRLPVRITHRCLKRVLAACARLHPATMKVVKALLNRYFHVAIDVLLCRVARRCGRTIPRRALALSPMSCPPRKHTHPHNADSRSCDRHRHSRAVTSPVRRAMRTHNPAQGTRAIATGLSGRGASAEERSQTLHGHACQTRRKHKRRGALPYECGRKVLQ